MIDHWPAPPPGYEPVNLGEGFSRQLGTVYLDRQGSRLAFLLGAEHANPVQLGHGGAIATFADAQVVALYGDPTKWRAHMPTINLSIQYLAPVELGSWLEAAVSLVKATRTMIFSQAIMTVAGRTVASSQAIYRNSLKQESHNG